MLLQSDLPVEILAMDDEDETDTSEKSILPPVLCLLFVVMWAFQFHISSAALGALVVYITFLDYWPLLLTVISFS